MGSTSLIDAHSTNLIYEHSGGHVTINSTGEVDIQKGAKIDVSGSTGGNSIFAQGQNNISIIGTCVNMDGVLQASEAVRTNTQLPSYWPEGPHSAIRLVATKGDVNIGPEAILQADSANALSNTRTITVTAAHDINQNGKIWANGSKGGALFLNSSVHPYWFLNGGRGGSISLNAGNDINQNGRISADGGNGTTQSFGGAGGTISFIAGESMINNGVIRAMGGNTNPAYVPSSAINRGGSGGSVSFNIVPNGNGLVSTLGGEGANPGILGSLTSPFVSASSNTLIGIWHTAP